MAANYLSHFNSWWWQSYPVGLSSDCIFFIQSNVLQKIKEDIFSTSVKIAFTLQLCSTSFVGLLNTNKPICKICGCHFKKYKNVQIMKMCYESVEHKRKKYIVDGASESIIQVLEGDLNFWVAQKKKKCFAHIVVLK